MGVSFFNEALAKDSNQAEALYNRARALSKLGRLEDSLKDFKKLTEIDDSNASYIGDYAVSLHLNDKNNLAKEAFEKALTLEPENPYRYSSRAFFKDRIGDLEGAIQDYEKAIALDPEDAVALNNKGLVEEKLGYKDKAKDSFDKSNELVGYRPESKTVSDDVSTVPNSTQETSSPTSRGQVIKSVFTKDGFKDFARFSKDLLSPKRKKK
ncbi:tetratricopeptide repeat protein [Fabibacter sp. E12]|nr:tetratricopeptide repeat protein [Roseivirga sp. E12]